MKRYLEDPVIKDLNKKIIIISGPRQVGKTTLSKQISKNSEYLNWDFMPDRARIIKRNWDRSKDILIFDELHKMKNFKSFLKGIYDKEGLNPPILVTGSARLDIARKMGDSLAGRFFPFRLHPLDLWELRGSDSRENIYNGLVKLSGFPEPYFENDEIFYSRWAKTHLDLILRQDLIDMESVKDIGGIETLIALLQTRVSSTVSYSSLSRDLERDPKTIKKWLTILENMFILLKVTPYHRNIARSLLKEPKYYFFDLARVIGDEGQKFENLVAISLKKQLDYLGDVFGIHGSLYFLKTRDKREIDFFIDWSDKKYRPVLIEVKNSQNEITNNFHYFKTKIKNSICIQLVKNMTQKKIFPNGDIIAPALEWLEEMPLIT